MTPEIYKQAKNVFIIFPPGCGGNHIANMLSLHDDFENRYDSENYNEEIIKSYIQLFEDNYILNRGDAPVHLSKLENLQPNTFDQNIDSILKTKKNIFFVPMLLNIYMLKD